MKIFILSNLYPPYDLSGYEQLCFDVTEELKRRGHDIFVLTSKYGLRKAVRRRDIWRALLLENYETPLQAIKRIFFYRRNFMLVKEAVEYFKPEIIFIWGMHMLQRTLPLSDPPLIFLSWLFVRQFFDFPPYLLLGYLVLC